MEEAEQEEGGAERHVQDPAFNSVCFPSPPSQSQKETFETPERGQRSDLVFCLLFWSHQSGTFGCRNVLHNIFSVRKCGHLSLEAEVCVILFSLTSLTYVTRL